MAASPTPIDAVLAVNIGSSSIKFSTHPVIRVGNTTSAGASIFHGNIQGLEPNGKAFSIWSHDGQQHHDSLRFGEGEDEFIAALSYLKGLLEQELTQINLIAVAHRVVHGGELFCDSIRIGEKELQQLKTLEPLAPLHQPHNIKGIRVFSKIFAQLPQIACFDTAFHASLSKTERTFPLTKAMYDQGIHRYGFHGLSYQYVSSRIAQKTDKAKGRLLMAHLGNGSSLCACVNGKSFATTMGFSAVGGLMMGTRCGDLDPGVVLHLTQQGMDSKGLEKLFYKQSGLLGISGISADMRILRESTHPDAAFAVGLYIHRVIRESGALIASMGGVDAITFAGGIGEHDADLRAQVCRKLSFAGVQIDETANTNASGAEIAAIHAPGSSVEVWVVPTDEGIVAAEEALALI